MIPLSITMSDSYNRDHVAELAAENIRIAGDLRPYKAQ